MSCLLYHIILTVNYFLSIYFTYMTVKRFELKQFGAIS